MVIMHPELADLLEAMCDLMLALADSPPDQARLDAAREQVETAMTALRRITMTDITR